jgi:hypothetical protein
MEIDEPAIEEEDPALAEHMREAEKNRIMNQQLLKTDGAEVVNIHSMLNNVNKEYTHSMDMSAVAQ